MKQLITAALIFAASTAYAITEPDPDPTPSEPTPSEPTPAPEPTPSISNDPDTGGDGTTCEHRIPACGVWVNPPEPIMEDRYRGNGKGGKL